jgi:iron-sulfur cluster assembly protein
MITITPAAAEQIKQSAEQGGMGSMPLRVAVTQAEDGSLQYAMGFDDARQEDHTITSEGVNVVISPVSQDLAKGMTLDYVQMDDGQYNFIFINPNDPDHRPPPQVEGGTVSGDK